MKHSTINPLYGLNMLPLCNLLVVIPCKMVFGSTVKLLLSDQMRDLQKAVAEEKGSPNATKVHHVKPSDNIYHTLTTHYFQQNPMLLVLI